MVANRTIKIKQYFTNLFMKCFIHPFPGSEEPQRWKTWSTNRNWCDLEGALGVR